MVSLTEGIRAGDHDSLARLVARHPSLITERYGDTTASCTVLHPATDWPGHLPGVRRTITLLVTAGADIEADGAVFTNGSPLSDAVVFAQW